MKVAKTVYFDVSDENFMKHLANMRKENVQACREIIEKADPELLSFISHVYLSKLYHENKQAYYDWIKVLNVVHKEESDADTDYKVGQKFTLTMVTFFDYIKVDYEIRRVDENYYYFTACDDPRGRLSKIPKKRFSAEVGKSIELHD